MKKGWSIGGVLESRSEVNLLPTTVGCIMTQHKSSCCAAVLASLCITFMPGGTTDCTDQVILTSSISGRNACPSEEVTFTCTTQGTALFWRSEAFGERTMHYTSPPSRGEFRAEIVSYDRNQSCLVSSLTFHATASRNGTTVMCTSRDRSSNQSLSLHTISNIVLENFTAVPDSFSSVQLEWKVVPSDGHYCIRNYNIQIAGQNGSHWEDEIPGSSQSFHFTGIQLMHLQIYTCCVTANLDHNQIGPIKQTLTVELQEPHPLTNLSAVIQCKQGYEIQIDWQAPLSDPLGPPLTGYLLKYQVYNNTSTIELPALNTSYTLDSVPSDVVYNITVSALNDVGPSKKNPSLQLVVPSLFCEDSWATLENASIMELSNYTDTSTESSNLTDSFTESSNLTDTYIYTKSNNVVSIITPTIGAMTLICGFLFATTCICYHVMIRRKKALKKVKRVSEHMAVTSDT